MAKKKAKEIKITLVKSPIGYNKSQKGTVAALGLRFDNNLVRENEGRKVPVTLFTKNGGMWLESIAATGCDGVGLDWTINIEDAKARIGDKVALQGNMDPSMLYAPKERIEQEVATILKGFGDTGTGHVFNLGHGIHPDVNPEHAGHFIEAVHRLSKPYHK